MKTAKVQGKAAPHKPILMLSIIHGLESGDIDCNRVYISAQLVATFRDLWHQLVKEQIFTPNFSMPFYHLKNDGFWHLQTVVGREILLTSSHSIKSLGHLKQVVDFGCLDNELYDLLTQPTSRAILKQTLLSKYFPGSTYVSDENLLMQEVLEQMLNDTPATYKERSKTFDEEEVFVRGGIFKREIPKIYNYTCCISGLRIIADRQVQMVDACHIIPFSESGDDTVSNGISLCPNLHRAFDRGLLTITEDYKVQLQAFHEEVTTHSIRQFEGRRILLPEEPKYYPKIENLRAHHQRFGFS